MRFEVQKCPSVVADPSGTGLEDHYGVSPSAPQGPSVSHQGPSVFPQGQSTFSQAPLLAHGGDPGDGLWEETGCFPANASVRPDPDNFDTGLVRAGDFEETPLPHEGLFLLNAQTSITVRWMS